MLLYFHPRPTIQNSEFKIHNLPIPPLAQACSLCPIQNSKFRIQNSQFSLHPPHITTAHCPPLFWRGGTGVRTPLAQACSLCPIHNSLPVPQFKIQNRCKGNFFWLYCQDIVPLHLEVTQKIGTIK